MTIAALCSAIRSQLYFSQVSSWVDLLRKAFVDGDMSVKEQMPSLFSPEIMQNPRLKKNLETMQVDLDILFRIKPFNGIASFDDKPNVHNFPDTFVSDRMALRVSLKSLPRLEKIPTLNTEKANSNGFTCDNRIKTSIPLGSPVAGSSCHLLNDRMAYPSCHEKGKHRCKDEDEEDYDHVEEKKQSVPSTATASLSHRERQLLKYKKRIMKRDKQKKKVHDGDQASSSSGSLNTSGSEEFEKFPDAPAINDTFAPLYGESTANHHHLNKTLSVATQTNEPICSTCGEHLQCWNCDKTPRDPTNSDSTESTVIDKAHLLLQAIQRTADAHPRDKTKDNIFISPKANCGESSASIDAVDNASCDNSNDNNDFIVNNNNNNALGDKEPSDCRLCKRQKTRHNYTSFTSVSSNGSNSSYRRTMSECLVGMSDQAEIDAELADLEPQLNYDDAKFNYAQASSPFGELNAYRRAFSDDIINQLPAESCCFTEDDEDCLTIKCKHCVNPDSALKLTPIVNLQQGRPVTSMSPHKKFVVHNQQQLQKIPKINLSQVFDNLKDDSGFVQDTSPTSDCVFTFNTSPASSYPPMMMQLSPRFTRGSSSLLKRRSRHISDRSSISEYSNISDEEEEVLKAVVHKVAPPSSSTKISSLYKKFVTKTHTAFNKLPLLGTIEESLLRDRFQPKAIVNGFKLLLGASGSFCPTQLTIPANSFFYEFKGMKHMSTPYVVS